MKMPRPSSTYRGNRRNFFREFRSINKWYQGPWTAWGTKRPKGPIAYTIVHSSCDWRPAQSVNT